MALRRRRAMRSARAEVCGTGPPRRWRVARILRTCAWQGRPRYARRAHETRRRKTWVGEPSNNHTETKKKTPVWLVVGRGDRSTRARARSIESGDPASSRRSTFARTAPGSPDPSPRSVSVAGVAMRRTCDAHRRRRMARRHGCQGGRRRAYTVPRDRARRRARRAPRHFVRLSGTIGATAEPVRRRSPVGRRSHTDARRADGPGRRAVARATARVRVAERRRRARTPPLDPTSTLPRPRVYAQVHRGARKHQRHRARARAARGGGPVAATSSPRRQLRGVVAAAALGGGVVVWHVRPAERVDASDSMTRANERRTVECKNLCRAPIAIGTCGGSAEAATTTKTSTGTTRCSPRSEVGDPSRFVASNRKNRASNRKNRASTAGRRAHRIVLFLSWSGHVARVTAACWTSTDGLKPTNIFVHGFAGRDGENVETRTRTRLADSDPSERRPSRTPVAIDRRGHFCTRARGWSDVRVRLRRDARDSATRGASFGCGDRDGERRHGALGRFARTAPSLSVGVPSPIAEKPSPEALDARRATRPRRTREDDRGRVLVWRIGDATIPSREFAARLPRRRVAVAQLRERLAAVEACPRRGDERNVRSPRAMTRLQIMSIRIPPTILDSSEDTDVLLARVDATRRARRKATPRDGHGGRSNGRHGARCALSPEAPIVRADGGRACGGRRGVVAKGCARGRRRAPVGVGGDVARRRLHVRLTNTVRQISHRRGG